MASSLMSRGYRRFLRFNAAFLILLAFIMVFPVFKVFVTSITTVGEYYANPLLLWPKNPTLDSYKYIFSTGEVPRAFSVTVFTTVVGTFLSMTFTLLLSYSLSKRHVPGMRIFHRILLVSMFLDSGLIPYYMMVKNLGLLESVWSSIIPAMISLWNYLVIRSFFLGLPSELEEAALIDGASWWRVFFSVVLPISLPVVATFTLFYAVDYWNTWYNCMLFNTGKDLQTMQLMLHRIVVAMESNWTMAEAYAAQTGQRNSYTEGIKMACCVVAMVPILVVYPFLQKYFVKGVMLGSLKG